MAYLLAIPAIALPGWLLIQVVRGRLRVTSCCAPVAPKDSAGLSEPLGG